MVALVKGTWALSPKRGLEPAHEQVVLQYQDTPSSSEKDALRLTSDLCEGKPRTDVLVISPSDASRASEIQGSTVSVAVGTFRFAKKVNGNWPFGPLSRTAPSRLQFAGTYDETWQQQRMPLLPADFDLRYHQHAPADQLPPHALSGDEPLRVDGLHAQLEGLTFHLPGKAVLITGNIRKEYFSTLAQLDTVQLWSDQPWLTLVWRLPIRPRQKIEEIGTVSVHMIRVPTARELYGLA